MPEDPDGTFIVSLALSLLFAALAALYAASESAVSCLSASQVKKDGDSGNKRAKALLKALEAQASLISPLQSGLLFCGLLGLAFCVAAFGGRDYPALTFLEDGALRRTFCCLRAAVVYVFLFFLLCDLLPKKAARHESGRFAYSHARLICGLSQAAMPFLRFTGLLSNGLLRLFRIDPHALDDAVTEEEILSMVSVGHEQGILHASEAEMITNIFEYGDKEAKDIMINRNNLIAIDCTMTLQEAAAFIVEAHNSRFPVYDETIDHIIGILHLKDVMRMQMNEKMRSRPIGKIKGLLREPRFITEKRKINDLFQVMQKEKIQMVIVIDEYGQTAGLVALEDILEEIVGNIQDEYDEDETYIRESGADHYVIQGMMPLEELEEKLQVSFEDEPFDTVNGFVISRLEHIPEEGEDFEFEYGGYTFRIMEVKDRMIQTVSARKNREET